MSSWPTPPPTPDAARRRSPPGRRSPPPPPRPPPTNSRARPGGSSSCEYPDTVSSQFGTRLGRHRRSPWRRASCRPAHAGHADRPGPPPTIYLVVQMRARLVPFATLRSSIRQAILAGPRLGGGQRSNALVRQAQFSVDPRYGTLECQARWSTVPMPPAPAFVLNAAANVPAPPSVPGGLPSISDVRLTEAGGRRRPAGPVPGWSWWASDRPGPISFPRPPSCPGRRRPGFRPHPTPPRRRGRRPTGSPGGSSPSTGSTTSAATIDEVYQAIVEELVAAATSVAGRRRPGAAYVVYAVPGSPFVAERTVACCCETTDG